MLVLGLPVDIEVRGAVLAVHMVALAVSTLVRDAFGGVDELLVVGAVVVMGAKV